MMEGYHFVWIKRLSDCVWVRALVPDWYYPELPPPGAQLEY